MPENSLRAQVNRLKSYYENLNPVSKLFFPKKLAIKLAEYSEKPELIYSVIYRLTKSSWWSRIAFSFLREMINNPIFNQSVNTIVSLDREKKLDDAIEQMLLETEHPLELATKAKEIRTQLENKISPYLPKAQNPTDLESRTENIQTQLAERIHPYMAVIYQRLLSYGKQVPRVDNQPESVRKSAVMESLKPIKHYLFVIDNAYKHSALNEDNRTFFTGGEFNSQSVASLLEHLKPETLTQDNINLLKKHQHLLKSSDLPLIQALLVATADPLKFFQLLKDTTPNELTVQIFVNNYLPNQQMTRKRQITQPVKNRTNRPSDALSITALIDSKQKNETNSSLLKEDSLHNSYQQTI